MRAKLSPAAALGRPVKLIIEANRKFGLEWWLLVIGTLVVLFIIYLAVFPGTVDHSRKNVPLEVVRTHQVFGAGRA